MQARMGVAGKGSLFTFSGVNNKSFAKKAGLLDEQGRFMVRGVDGTDFDIADYQGFVDASMVKNLMGFSDSEGKQYSNEQISEMFSALVDRYGIASIVDYANKQHTAKGLGPQTTAFMKIRPEFIQQQVNDTVKFFDDMRTPEGLINRVFADDPRKEMLMQHPEYLQNDRSIQNMVSMYITSMISRIGSGEWIDFNNEVSQGVSTVSPLQALLPGRK